MKVNISPDRRVSSIIKVVINSYSKAHSLNFRTIHLRQVLKCNVGIGIHIQHSVEKETPISKQLKAFLRFVGENK